MIQQFRDPHSGIYEVLLGAVGGLMTTAFAGLFIFSLITLPSEAIKFAQLHPAPAVTFAVTNLHKPSTK